MCELLNRIWSRPRGEWTRVLRKELPALAAEIVEELLHGIPEFSALIDDNDAIDDELLRQCVEEALLTALGYQKQTREQKPDEDEDQDRDEDPDEDPDESEDDIADTDMDTDMDMDMDTAGVEAETKAGTRARIKAGIPFQRNDECEVTHEGRYEVVREGVREGARESARAGGGAGDRAREDLFNALTDDRAACESSLVELAEAAGWPLPPAVRAIVPASPVEAQQLAAVLADALTGTFAGRPCLLVPSLDPDTRAPLDQLLRGRFAAVGHAVPLRDTASSLRWALRLFALTPARPGLELRAVFVDDHLSTLLLLQDEPLAHALAARWLRPLADLTPRQSERLEVTLLAWLEGGGAPEAAKALSVHPQTVRYRMRQLEKLFGTGLRDPRTRFELEMALRSRRLMAQVRRQHSRVSRRAARVITADFTPLVVGRMARVNGL
ncbi:PucR family transcriptional regulator [Streptomyces sp. NPDC005533]|uniref:PucR family transcriptional regulator n=1 Tax=Streptomyces sp. NPDC005533 TaxID=3364723 RepID=UPI0036750C29